MKLGEAQEIFTYNLSKLIQHSVSLGYTVRLREVERTSYQQQQYLKLGVSKTMNSLHLKSLAADIYFFKKAKLILSKKQLKELGAYWESLDKHNRWGGNFKSFTDTPHFEMDI